jgi:acylphosphatase
LVVRGRVQGVGFRIFVRDLGTRLGLDGWVRNLPDGRSVETVAQGDSQRLSEFVAGVRRGPPGSYVGEFEETAEKPDAGIRGFKITR